MNNNNEISVQSLERKKNNKDNFLLIDVREKHELEICKISDSVHIPMSQIPENISEINTSNDIIVMCKSGIRSHKVCEYLREQGFSNVYNLEGGIIKWALDIDTDMKIY